MAQNPLHTCSRADGAKALIAAGYDATARDEKGRTPLHRTAMLSTMAAAVPVLVEAGVDVNARDNEGRSPLHHAAAGRSVEAARTLIAAGADLNARESNDGCTPLHFLFVGQQMDKADAYAAATREIAVLLLNAGARRDIKSDSGRTALSDDQVRRVRALHLEKSIGSGFSACAIDAAESKRDLPPVL